MQFRLRTLLIVLAIGPMVSAGAWKTWLAFHKNRDRRPAIDWSTVAVPLIIGPEEPPLGSEPPAQP